MSEEPLHLEGQEIASCFRFPTGCQSLQGQAWTASELFGPAGTVDGAHNNIYYRAKVAMQEKLEQQQERLEQARTRNRDSLPDSPEST